MTIEHVLEFGFLGAQGRSRRILHNVSTLVVIANARRIPHFDWLGEA